MENQNKAKNIILWILIIIAFAVTVDLAFIYYQANFNAHALPSFCTISDFIDCDGVARTTESQFFGVPLAYWGIFLYAFIAMLMCVDFLKKIPFLKFLEVFKNKYHYIASLGLISFTISMVLLCVSLSVIKKLCIMCAITYVLNLAIGLVAAHGIEGNFAGALKQSWKDFIDALKPIPYRVAFTVVMICAFVFLSWTYTSAKFSPALQHQRKYGEFINQKVNKYAIKGNILGSKEKDAVILHVFSDYRCPICAPANIMIHKVVREFKNVRVEHHNLPLDMSCNANVHQPFHIGSCELARYALAAKKQNKFWEVDSFLFTHQSIPQEEMLQALKNSGLGLNIKQLEQDAKSPEIEREIQNDIGYAFSKGILGTPALKMDNDFEMGIKGYPELKEWIIKHGGKTHGLF